MAVSEHEGVESSSVDEGEYRRVGISPKNGTNKDKDKETE